APGGSWRREQQRPHAARPSFCSRRSPPRTWPCAPFTWSWTPRGVSIATTPRSSPSTGPSPLPPPTSAPPGSSTPRRSSRRRIARAPSSSSTGRAHAELGQTEAATRQFAQLIAEAPRSYYGILASRRAPHVQPSPGRNPASAQLAASLPADPRELLQAEAPWARVEALRAVG